MDRNTEFYFVSTRAHDATLGTLFRFDFAKGPLTGVVPVAGITGGRRRHIDVDAEISADGADGT